MNNLQYFINNFVFSENELYSFSFLFIFIIFCLNLIYFTYKTFNIIKFNKYARSFEEDFWSGKMNMPELFKIADNMKGISITAKMYVAGFKDFYSIYKINTKFQISSAIDLTRNTMNIILYKKINDDEKDLNKVYISSLFILFSSFLMSIWTFIDILKILNNNYSLEIMIFPLFVFVFGIILSFFNYVFYLVLENKIENEFKNNKAFISEFTNYLHRNFYHKDSGDL